MFFFFFFLRGGLVLILLGILHQLIKTTTKTGSWECGCVLGGERGAARDGDDAREVFAVGGFVAVEVDYADSLD